MTSKEIREVYLDNSATTAVFPDIAEKIKDVMVFSYGNPSSLHRKGMEAELIVSEARKQISRSLGAQEEEIIFTSGGTEANNLALFGAVAVNKRRGNRIISSSIEHPSVLETLKRLGEAGYEVVLCPVNSRGMIEPEQVASLVTKDTILVTIMMVNNEIGTIQPLKELVRAARTVNPGLVFHSDCVQAYGKVKADPNKTGVDLATISSHKIHGPKGVGALYVKAGTSIQSQLMGGGQERQIRSGTENVPGIVGFGMAAERAIQNLDSNVLHMQNLKNLLLERLYASGLKFAVNGPDLDAAAPHIINISFPGVRGEVLVHFLEGMNIFISTGAACSSRKVKLSHVLKAIGIDPKIAEGSVRISFSVSNDSEDVELLARGIETALTQMGVH